MKASMITSIPADLLRDIPDEVWDVIDAERKENRMMYAEAKAQFERDIEHFTDAQIEEMRHGRE